MAKTKVTCNLSKKQSSVKKKTTSPTEMLCTGESKRGNTYQYRWMGNDRVRHSVTAKTLTQLRKKETDINNGNFNYKFDKAKPQSTQSTQYVTIDAVYQTWLRVKRGIRDNTFQNYQYIYSQFIKPRLGGELIANLKKTDVKMFYNSLANDGMKISTIDGIHNILHQILQIAVDDGMINTNPTDNAVKELKTVEGLMAEKKRGLTAAEEKLFLDYLFNTPKYQHWYPLFAVMVGSGLRVGEVTGLRWCDIDIEGGVINVDHTLIYYPKNVDGVKQKCTYDINPPKTRASYREVPMLDYVKKAFQMELNYHKTANLVSHDDIRGYYDFVFINRFGEVHNQNSINKALKRIIRDCNYEEFNKCENPPVLLPYFSCHNLRHTFTTRMIEAGVNLKVVQDTLGHSDFSTTMNIYTDATRDFKAEQFAKMNEFMNKVKAEGQE